MSTVKSITEGKMDRPALIHEYRAILERDDAPQKGDAERLAELADLLGKSPADMQADLKAIEQVRQLTPSAEQEQALSRELAEAGEAVRQYQAETERIIREREEGLRPLEARRNQAAMTDNRLRQNKLQASDLKRRHRDLFKPDARPAEQPGPRNTIQTTHIEPSKPTYRPGEEPHPLPMSQIDGQDVVDFRSYPHRGKAE